MSSFAATLGAVASQLRCPNCGASLIHSDRALGCEGGHSFDIARQGYVALLAPRRKLAPGDSVEMLAARERFLAAGHYRPIAEAITAAAGASIDTGGGSARIVADLGAGTGYYLAALLEALPDSLGVALDSSQAAVRRAVRAHPRVAAVRCDVWQELPLRDATVRLILDVFAPRNGEEIARVLAPDGALVVVTPTSRHLQELVADLGMLLVEADKQAHLHSALFPSLCVVSSRELEFTMTLGRADVEALVAMGPSAHHLDAEEVRVHLERARKEEIDVTASVVVQTFGPSQRSPAGHE